jgi:hypothetical protein
MNGGAPWLTKEVIDIDVLDTRLTDKGIQWYCEWTRGGDPNRRVRVDGSTPLDAFLQTIKSRIDQRKIGVLSILAHGFGEYEYTDATKKKRKAIHPGFGIQFGSDNILPATVERFKALNGLFAGTGVGIKLMGCGAAAQYRFREAPNGSYKTGFGKDLCKKLAATIGASVMASEALQEVQIDENPRTYRWGNDIQTIPACASFGDWEGQVWIFSPDGGLAKAGTPKGSGR